jgi:hypothetical protein
MGTQTSRGVPGGINRTLQDDGEHVRTESVYRAALVTRTRTTGSRLSRTEVQAASKPTRVNEISRFNTIISG